MCRSFNSPSLNKKTKRYSWLIALSVLFLLPHSGKTQGLLAQYPLETEGQKVLRLYDVSGNGNHGTLVKNSASETPEILQGGDFANGVTCINKLNNEDARIEIPDLYKKHDFTAQGFTVSFWLFVDNKIVYDNSNSDKAISSVIISLPAFTVIQLKNPGKATTNIRLYYSLNDQSPGTVIDYPFDFETSGWYYIAIAYYTQGSHVDFSHYYYDGKSYDPDKNALLHTNIPNVPKLSPSKALEGWLLDQSFTGKIWNIKFYDLGLGVDNLNKDRNNSWYLSLKDMSYGEKNNYYINLSALQHYPFNRTLNDTVHRRTPVGQSGISFTTDRFGTAGKSLKLAPDGYVTYASFSLPVGNSPACNVVKGYTVSFWTYIDKPLFPPDDPSVPFTDADIRYQVFSVHDEHSVVLAGMNLVRDRLVVNRYIPTNPVRPWELWLWDPVSFQNQPGWYHVVLSQKENAMRVVVFKPNGSEACRLNYFRAQDFMSMPLVSFGHVPENIIGRQFNAVQSLDDFRIYNWPFSESEAATLHAFEMIKQ